MYNEIRYVREMFEKYPLDDGTRMGDATGEDFKKDYVEHKIKRIDSEMDEKRFKAILDLYYKDGDNWKIPLKDIVKKDSEFHCCPVNNPVKSIR
jgi:hypothetical protein